jgi:hypothetical protein
VSRCPICARARVLATAWMLDRRRHEGRRRPGQASRSRFHVAQSELATIDLAGLWVRPLLTNRTRLADDPCPAGSFSYGSPDLRRLRIGQYRVLNEITEEAVAVRHIARGTAS